MAGRPRARPRARPAVQPVAYRCASSCVYGPHPETLRVASILISSARELVQTPGFLRLYAGWCPLSPEGLFKPRLAGRPFVIEQRVQDNVALVAVVEYLGLAQDALLDAANAFDGALGAQIPLI